MEIAGNPENNLVVKAYLLLSVRTFFRNGQPQVYFDIRESNHGVIYFLCYDYVL